MKYNFKGLKMSAKEYVTGLLERVRPVIAYVVGAVVIVLVTAWFTGSAAANSVDKVIDSRIDIRIDARLNEKVVPTLNTINEKLDYLVSAQQNQLVFDINKQVSKIKECPADMKRIDVESIMTRWNTFPESLKTDLVKSQYEFVRKWYEDNK